MNRLDDIDDLKERYISLVEKSSYSKLPLVTDTSEVQLYEKDPLTVSFEAFELGGLELNDAEIVELQKLKNILFEQGIQNRIDHESTTELLILRAKQFDRLFEKYSNNLDSLITQLDRVMVGKYMLSPAYFQDGEFKTNLVLPNNPRAIAMSFKLKNLIEGVFLDKPLGKLIEGVFFDKSLGKLVKIGVKSFY
jgi:hypothetical protein